MARRAMELTRIKRDWPVVAREGSVAIGAVRKVWRDVVEVYIEGYGDVALRAAQITAAHDAKVVLALEARPDLSTDK